MAFEFTNSRIFSLGLCVLYTRNHSKTDNERGQGEEKRAFQGRLAKGGCTAGYLGSQRRAACYWLALEQFEGTNGLWQ